MNELQKAENYLDLAGRWRNRDGAERKYRWERDPRWEMLCTESTYRCRYVEGRPLMRCPKRAVAQMNRSFRPDYPTWRAYCADHLYGRRIVDGVVMHRSLVEERN